MTATEKILAKKSNNASVRPGDNIWVNVDKLMTHDVCGPGTFGIFQKEFGENAQVWDRERVVIIPDHYIFTSDARANRNVDILREMVQKYNIKYFYDITDRSDFRANPKYKGVCHIALAEEGHCKARPAPAIACCPALAPPRAEPGPARSRLRSRVRCCSAPTRTRATRGRSGSSPLGWATRTRASSWGRASC